MKFLEGSDVWLARLELVGFLVMMRLVLRLGYGCLCGGFRFRSL